MSDPVDAPIDVEKGMARVRLAERAARIAAAGDEPHCYRCGRTDGLFHTKDGLLCTGCCIEYAENWQQYIRGTAKRLANDPMIFGTDPRGSNDGN